MNTMAYTIEMEREADGRWIAEVSGSPGVMACGDTEEKAILNAQTLALRVLADQIEERKEPAGTLTVSVAPRP